MPHIAQGPLLASQYLVSFILRGKRSRAGLPLFCVHVGCTLSYDMPNQAFAVSCMPCLSGPAERIDGVCHQCRWAMQRAQCVTAVAHARSGIVPSARSAGTSSSRRHAPSTSWLHCLLVLFSSRLLISELVSISCDLGRALLAVASDLNEK